MCIHQQVYTLKKNEKSIIFKYIFRTFPNLEYLKYGSSSISCPRLSFPDIISSNLLELHVSLKHFSDCLTICDESFNQLHTLDVNILKIQSSDLIIDKTVKLVFFNV